jgi:hypothetical protein
MITVVRIGQAIELLEVAGDGAALLADPRAQTPSQGA